MPASELRDRHVSASDVWGGGAAELEDRLAGAGPGGRLELLLATVAAREVVPDPLAGAATAALARPAARVATVAAELGVSERSLHRRVLAAVGYGPKTLARVARLRRLIALGDEPLASRAFAAGYASQAHMSDEVRRLTGTTPVRFLKDAALTAA
jgi:methylphosphotriester-DNA--protein-cysteine methyltransferase